MKPLKPTRRFRRLLGALLIPVAASTLIATPPPFMMGVNLAGAEFGASELPGTYNTHYVYPGVAQLDYYKARGIELVRLPFKWERIQHALYGPLDATELGRLDTFLNQVETRGMRVILDMHNYARRRVGTTTHVIGSAEVPRAAFQDVWERLAAHVKDRDCIWAYGIMNEPYGLGAHTWLDSAQVAVNGIRNHDTRHAILIPGDQYSGAHWWMTHGAPLIAITDPANNLIFEAHQYFDRDSSGNYAGTYVSEGANPNTGVQRLTDFVNWCNANGVRGFVGEYGVPDNDSRWLTVLDNALSYLEANNISGTYWAGGPWWGNYALSSEIRRVGEEAPQMSVLIPRGSGVGTRYWPPYVWYRDAIASSPQGNYGYNYKSDNATLAVNFADPASAVGNYGGAVGIRFDYTVLSGGYAGAGMHITGGVRLAPNFERDHVLAFQIKGTAGSSVRVFFRDVNGVSSAKVNTASYVTTTGSWQQVRIPLSQFITASFTGAERVDRIAFEGLPMDNLARTIQLDQFSIEKAESVAPVVSVASPLGSSFVAGQSFQVTATAADASGIDYVSFLLNGEQVAIDETAPYGATISLPEAGAYRLTAIAYDMHGNPGRSAPVVLTATPAGPVHTLVSSDLWSETSFNTGLRWSNALAPVPTADYRVDAGLQLRSPGNSASHAFAGRSLTLAGGGSFLLRTTAPGVVTVGDLRCDGAVLGLGVAGSFTLAGGIDIRAGGLELNIPTATRLLTVASKLSGPGALTVNIPATANHVTLTNSNNVHTGGTIVAAGLRRAPPDHPPRRGGVVGAHGATLRLTEGATHDYIANHASVVIGGSGTLVLAFTGADTVGALSLDGGATYVAPGEWGAPGSGAANTSARLTGTGRLVVTGVGGSAP